MGTGSELSGGAVPAGSECVLVSHIEQKNVSRWLLQRVLKTSHVTRCSGSVKQQRCLPVRLLLLKPLQSYGARGARQDHCKHTH